MDAIVSHIKFGILKGALEDIWSGGRLRDLDNRLPPGLRVDEPSLCRCCLKGMHHFYLCPYGNIVPEGAKVGHGFSLYCKDCCGKDFCPDAEQTCVCCGGTTKMAVENQCYICGEWGDHLEQDCELAEFVDWDAVTKRTYKCPPLLVGEELDEALRLKAMRDRAHSRYHQHLAS